MITIYQTEGIANLLDAKCLKVVDTLEEAKDVVNSFLKDHRSEYHRVISDGDDVVIDYGSWTKFLLIKGISYEEYFTKR